MIAGETLPTAARAFGAIAAQGSGRAALRELGLSGEEAPSFVCALYDTTVAEVAPYAPTTILVIDVTHRRLATLAITGSPSTDDDYEVQPSTKLGFVVDCMETTRQPDLSLAILGHVHGTITDFAA